jgi:hypothetical protein
MNYNNCIVCKKSELKFLLKILHYTLHYCKNCFHIQSNNPEVVNPANILFTREPQQLLKRLFLQRKQMTIQLPFNNFVTECNYDLLDLLELGQVSFFSTNSLKYLCDKNNVCLDNIITRDDTCIYYITKQPSKSLNETIIERLLHEIESELYSECTYFKYTAKYIILKNTVQNYILLQNIYA